MPTALLGTAAPNGATVAPALSSAPPAVVVRAAAAAAPNARPVSVVLSMDTADLVLSTVAEAAVTTEVVTPPLAPAASFTKAMALPAPDGQPIVLGSTSRLCGTSTSPP